MERARFAKFAWGALGYNLIVIAWGAYVRASGSGAGCGAHWPLCNGEVVPRAPAVKTVVELSHRLSSGVALIIALAIAVLAFRVFEKGSPVRKAGLAVLGLTVVEALIGAFLVLFELVAHDASMKRALSMVLHLGNTFLLLAALTITAHLATRTPAPEDAAIADAAPAAPARLPFTLRALLVTTAAGLMIVGMSGGIAALGDTLFPATSFAEGLRQELTAGAHLLLRLRVLHPIFAIVAACLAAASAIVARVTRPDANVVRWANVLTGFVVAQIVIGLANLGLLAPIALQLVHLLFADLVWISFVLLWIHASPSAAFAHARNTTRLRPVRLAS